MSILSSYRHGVKEASRRPNLCLLIWLFNFIFASLAAVLFYGAFGGALGSSRTAADLSPGAALNAVVEFLATSQTAVRELTAAAAALIVLNAIASVFLNGGILNVLLRRRTGEGFAATFFSGAGRYFGRFLKLAVYSLVLYIPAGIIFSVLHGILRQVAREPVREQLGFVLFFVRIAVAMFLISCVRMVLDYARIAIVNQDSRGVFEELGGALRFVASRPVPSFGLYCLLAATGIGMFAVYLGVRTCFEEKSTALILAGFFWAQVFIVSRGWLRVAFQAGQADLFRSAEHPRRQHEQRLDEIENGVDREAEQSERQRQQPDERVEDKSEEGDRPTDHEKQQP